MRTKQEININEAKRRHIHVGLYVNVPKSKQDKLYHNDRTTEEDSIEDNNAIYGRMNITKCYLLKITY